MTRRSKITHQFVDLIPDQLEEGVVYVCIKYATVVHRCCCGCGSEVVTPISPTGWQLTFDGISISLYPSIGNWSFRCKSHYWIQRNQIKWARQWSTQEIEMGRAVDQSEKEQFFGTDQPPTSPPVTPSAKTRSNKSIRSKGKKPSK